MRIPVHGGVSVLGLLLVAGGCGPEGPDVPLAPTVRDSAGVRVVEHPGAPVPTGAFTLEPLYGHGHGPDDHAFGMAWLGALLPDGTAVVADGMSQEVVLVQPDGRTASVLAPTGPGPREVRRVLSVHAVGRDTIWVEDDGNGKLMLFAGDRLARTLSTRGRVSLNRGLRVLGVDGSGRFLMSTSAYRSDFDVPWLPGHMVVYDPDGGRVDTVGTYDMASRRPEESINPFGYFGYVTAAAGDFVHARTDRPELIWREPEGGVRQIVRWSPVRRYPTQRHWERFEARLRADLRRVNLRLGGEELDAFVDRQLARYEMDPEAPLPLFSQLHGDDTGGVWLAEYVPGSGARTTRYRVVSPEGEWLGVVEFPTPFTVLDVRDDLVLGSFADEMDVEAIAVYRFRHEPAGS